MGAIEIQIGKNKIKVDVPENLEPVFSNGVLIMNRWDEFSLIFIRSAPGRKPVAKAIITLTPKHAKRFLKELEANIKSYEEQFGEIKLPGDKEKKESTSYIG